MSKHRKWIPISEAAAHVMRVKHCSHHEAIKLLAEANNDGKLPVRKRREKAPLVPLKPAEAVARLDDDPKSVFITLAEFRKHGGFTSEEVLGELRSGRLIASASDTTWFRMGTEGIVEADQIAIRADAVVSWMTNPETPPHLLAQWRGKTDERRH